MPAPSIELNDKGLTLDRVNAKTLAQLGPLGATRKLDHACRLIQAAHREDLELSFREALKRIGVEGVLSHETALDLYELSDVNPTKIHITVPKRYRLRRREAPPAYRFHHEDLDTHDITRHEGLPIVTPTKAIRQCHEAYLRRDLLRQALEQVRERGLLNRSAYAELMHEVGFDPATAPTR